MNLRAHARSDSSSAARAGGGIRGGGSQTHSGCGPGPTRRLAGPLPASPPAASPSGNEVHWNHLLAVVAICLAALVVAPIQMWTLAPAALLTDNLASDDCLETPDAEFLLDRHRDNTMHLKCVYFDVMSPPGNNRFSRSMSTASPQSSHTEHRAMPPYGTMLLSNRSASSVKIGRAAC